MSTSLSNSTLRLAFESLAIRLKENASQPLEIVVCGGAALILTGVVTRVTTDVDILALMSNGSLLSPDPLPEPLLQAAVEVAEDLDLPHDWLNNGPSKGEGGLFQMGLPEGIGPRLRPRSYGSALTVHFTHRIDLIHFKLYAAADRGGYHIEDLLALAPSPSELETAARWAMTHDVSPGFVTIVADLLRQLGHEDVADRL